MKLKDNHPKHDLSYDGSTQPHASRGLLGNISITNFRPCFLPNNDSITISNEDCLSVFMLVHLFMNNM